MDMVNISVGTAVIAGLLGYIVVFFGLILLMLVIMAMGKIFIAKAKKEKAAAEEAVASAVDATVEVDKPEAHGTAGELKLYDTDPRDAAMVMAIVADTLGKPLNQLRFISIKEVKE